MSKINPTSIVLDTDDVILDFKNGFHIQAQLTLQKELIELNQNYSMSERYGITKKEEALVWQALDNGGWANLPLLPGADKAIHTLQEMGMKVHIITCIDPKNEKYRMENFEKYNIKPDTIDCAGAGTFSKTPYIQKYMPIGLVDDRLQHINENLFVPHRVWVELKDDQVGMSAEHATFRANSLAHFVESCKAQLSADILDLSMPHSSFKTKLKVA